MKTSNTRKVIASLLTLTFVISSSFMIHTSDISAEAATLPGVEYHSIQDIKNYCRANEVDIYQPTTYNSSPIFPNYPGQLSEESKEGALATVKQIRYIAGLSTDVSIDDASQEAAMAGALVGYNNQYLSHTPKKPSNMSTSMYELGYKGTSNSSIGVSGGDHDSMNSNIISGFVADWGDSNRWLLGHRRNLLDPRLKDVGFGAVCGANGSYFSLCNLDDTPIHTKYYPIAWPAQNTPVEYIDCSDQYFNHDEGEYYAWSFSTGVFEDKNAVEVKLTNESTGDTYYFSEDNQDDGYFHVNNDGCGEIGCIIFNPEIEKYNAGDTFKVEITGLKNGDVTYTVNMFSLYEDYSPTEFLNLYNHPLSVTANMCGIRLYFTEGASTIKYHGTALKYEAKIKKNKKWKTYRYKYLQQNSGYIYNPSNNKTYLLKTRAYVKINGVTYYSNWCTFEETANE